LTVQCPDMKLARKHEKTKIDDSRYVLPLLVIGAEAICSARAQPAVLYAAGNLGVDSSTRRTPGSAVATHLSTRCVKQFGRASCFFQSNPHTTDELLRSAQGCANEPRPEIAEGRYSVAMLDVLFPPDAPVAEKAKQKRLRTHQISFCGDVQNLLRHKPGEYILSSSRKQNQR